MSAADLIAAVEDFAAAMDDENVPVIELGEGRRRAALTADNLYALLDLLEQNNERE